MKNTLLALVSVSILVLGISTAHAANPNAAIVLKDLDHPVGCSSGFHGTIPPLFTTEGIHTTATSSGNVTLICHFNIPEGFEPTRAVRDSGFSCTIFLPTGDVFTNNTRFVATPGGTATLICQITGDQLQ